MQPGVVAARVLASLDETIVLRLVECLEPGGAEALRAADDASPAPVRPLEPRWYAG